MEISSKLLLFVSLLPLVVSACGGGGGASGQQSVDASSLTTTIASAGPVNSEGSGLKVLPEPDVITTGGAGGETCRVTTLIDAGAGSLRDCVDNRTMNGSDYVPRTIVFDVGGEIRLFSDLDLVTPYLTIDGSTAPAPGITIRKTTFDDGEVRIASNGSSSGHDIIVRYLRFDGEWDMLTEATAQNTATITIDGLNEPNAVYNIVLDHLTIQRATDAGPNILGDVHDVSIQWCVFYNSLRPTTVSQSGAGQQASRISFHHNLYAFNHEENPRISGNVSELDFRNNIVYEWQRFASGAGVTLEESDGMYPTDMNFVKNFFFSNQAPQTALTYSVTPYPGDVYLDGNYLPVENPISSGTVASEFAMPATLQSSTDALEKLPASMLPVVGTHYRTDEEQQIIDEISDVMTTALAG